MESKIENTKKNFSVLIVDDHEIVHHGLHAMLDSEEDIKIVGEAICLEEALALAELYSPDIILIDTKVAEDDGIEAINILKEKYPDTKVIMFALNEEDLSQALKAGAMGYLLKDIKRDELVNALRTVGKGRLHISSLSRKSLTKFVSLFETGQHNLSERELIILQLISNGVKTREISEQLSGSEAMIKRDVMHIFNKLAVRNRSEAVAEALKRKII